jgi:hypothetical protein
MTAIKAPFGRRVELVYLDKGTSIPPSFVFQLPHKLRPSHIRDSLSKLVVLDHILDLQALHTYDLVLTYDLSRELVLIISPSIGNTHELRNEVVEELILM